MSVPGIKRLLLAGLLAGGILALSGGAQSTAPGSKPAAAGAPGHYLPNQLPRRAQMYYQGVWGIDSLGVRLAESGEIVRFNYRVLDPDKAQALNDKKAEPELIDPQAGVKLVVPAVDFVGPLRQNSTAEAGRAYWVAFSNKGRPVKHGDRVTVVIGQFRAEGLVVE